MKLPKGWSISALDDIVSDLDAGVSVVGEDRPSDVGEFGVLKVSAVSNGCFLPEQNKRITGNELQRATVKPRKGAILVSRCNTLSLVGDNALVKTTHDNLFLPDKLWQLKFHDDAQVDAEWLSQVLQTRKVRAQLVRQATGTSGSMKNISKESFLALEIFLPPLPEQRKIAEILGAWDEGLEKLDALIAAKERCKKGLMQRLLTGKRREAGCSDKRNNVRASALFAIRCERNAENLPALSVTQDQGVLFRNELDRRIQSDAKNLCNYKIVREGDFIISLRSFEGGLEYAAITGAVSPAYHVIRPTTEVVSAYYKHYFKSPDFIGRLAVAVIGIRDGKQVSIDDFMLLKIPSPSIVEQRAIADILDACDEELRLLRARRAAVERQKRGLMQRLLTGRTRTHGQEHGHTD